MIEPESKISILKLFLVNRDLGTSIWQRLLYYPDALITGFSSHFLVGLIWFPILVITLMKLKKNELQLPILLIWIPLVLLTIHPYSMMRQFFLSFTVLTTFLPSLFEEIHILLRNRKPLEYILFVYICLVSAIGLKNFFSPHRLFAHQPLSSILDFIDQNTNSDESIMVIGTTNELPPDLIRSRICLQHNHWNADCQVFFMDMYHNPDERGDRVISSSDMEFYFTTLKGILSQNGTAD